MSMTQTLADDTMVLDTENYQTEAAEPVPYPGNYLIKVLSAGRAKDKDGNDRLVDGWPDLRINRVQITNEDGTTMRFAVFQDIRTKPTQRPAAGNQKKWASQAADVLRAIDIETFNEQNNFEEVYETLERVLPGAEFVAFSGLTARDSAYIKSAITEMMSQAEKNEIFNKATLGTAKFQNPDKTYRFVAEGPSGATLTARATLSRFVPSVKRGDVELGPQKA